MYGRMLVALRGGRPGSALSRSAVRPFDGPFDRSVLIRRVKLICLSTARRVHQERRQLSTFVLLPSSRGRPSRSS